MDGNLQRFSRIVFVVFLVITIANSLEDDPVVTLAHGGKLRGSLLTSRDGERFYAFRGIPYAEPPTGKLRFKPPVTKRCWHDVILDATKDGPICIQTDFSTNAATGQEDCLTINVYTKQLPDVPSQNVNQLPVLVYIHGGAFMLGDGTSTSVGPQFLMDTEIVLVSLNYRLGAFGFLSTGDEASPGNYGYLDQALALQWVQDNIEIFGGDKNHVTIFGESSGGTSVGHHILSPISKGLFHGAIMMSGTATCPNDINEDVSYWSKKLAKDVGCPTDNNQILVDCLRDVPAEQIVNLTITYVVMLIFPIPFTPTVDGHFLPDYPLNLLHSPDKLNRVPVISGVTEREGDFLIADFLSSYPNKSLTSDDFLTDVIGYWFGRNQPIPEVTELVKKSYLGSVDRNNETQLQEALSEALHEGIFSAWHYETIRLLRAAGFQTYTYSYNYKANYSFVQELGIKQQNGPSHMDDLIMFFPFATEYLTKMDQEMSKTLNKIWTHFAKFGAPVSQASEEIPKWPPVVTDILPVYTIDEPITVQYFDLLKDEKFNFWTTDVRNARSKFQDSQKSSAS